MARMIHAGMFRRTDMPIAFVPAVLNELTADERTLLSTTAGCIIDEDDQGFVDVTYYDTAAELEAAWLECEQDCQSDDGAE
jgi:hypothetical protein